MTCAPLRLSRTGLVGEALYAVGSPLPQALVHSIGDARIRCPWVGRPAGDYQRMPQQTGGPHKKGNFATEVDQRPLSQRWWRPPASGARRQFGGGGRSAVGV